MLPKNEINRSSLLKLLSTKPVLKITFKKSTTNSIRVMLCTLSSTEIPSNHQKALASVFTDTSNPDILPVWDIVKGGWRSFRISNILSVDEDITETKNTKNEK